MARSSGAAGSGAVPESFDHGEFSHAASGFRYRVYRAGGKYLVEFAKADGSLHGKVALAYFVGSGATARSYLLDNDGFLFEAPAAFYAAGEHRAGGAWGLAPGYERYPYPYLTRPALPGCLTCHASFLQAVEETQNRFATPPFGEGGVACERCHGAGREHIARMRSGHAEEGTGILNPAKLEGERRDSICAQCHLSGEVRVMRPGADWRSFHPGERLSDSLTVFVSAAGSPGMQVTSHMEKLAQSGCKRGAGERLWCGTCHDPHRLPKPGERAAWFRGKCLGCHRESACKGAPPGSDCVSCHMPKGGVTDAEHVVYTDHSIPRRPRTGVTPRPAHPGLVAFGGGAASERDVALAYAIAAGHDESGSYRARAQTLLEKVERESKADVEVLLYLAEIYRNGGRAAEAVPLYLRAMKLDRRQVTASVGLGGIYFEQERYGEAIPLWEDALRKNSGLELVRLNLAMAQWRNGDAAGAEASLMKAVAMSPGFAAAREMLGKLRAAMGERLQR